MSSPCLEAFDQLPTPGSKRVQVACLPQELPVSTYGEQPARALQTRASDSCRRPCPALSDPAVGGVPFAALEQLCASRSLDWLGS